MHGDYEKFRNEKMRNMENPFKFSKIVDQLLAGLILFAVAVIVVLLLIWIWTGKFSEIFTGVIVFLGILGVVFWFVKLLLGKK